MGCGSSSPDRSHGVPPPATQLGPAPPAHSQESQAANREALTSAPKSQTEKFPDETHNKDPATSQAESKANDVTSSEPLSGTKQTKKASGNDSNGNVNNGNEENQTKPLVPPTPPAPDPEPQGTGTPQPNTSITPTPSQTPTTDADAVTPAESPTQQNQQGSDWEGEEQRLAEAQARFDAGVRCACLLTTPESVLERANKDVRCLQLQRSLPHTLPVFSVMQRLPHLQELDLSDNQMGPQAFRALMFAMGHNETITVFNVANNHTDTDCAESVGTMLKNNSSLISLNLSGNYLGKDFLSRCIGPALATNNTLQHLNCEGVGSIDLSVLVEGACCACSLVSLNLSHNTMSNTAPFVKHLVAWLQQDKCQLSSLDMRNCGLKGNDLLHVVEALKTNSSLTTLNISSNQVPSTNDFAEFLIGCLSCPNLKSLAVDSIKADQENQVSQGEKLQSGSTIMNLNLAGCQLKDEVVAAVLARLPDGGLAKLEDLNLSNNPDITIESLKQFITSIKGSDGCSSLQKLSYGLNSAEDIGAALGGVKGLTYLNLRRARMSPAAVASLGALTESGGLETLILDNIKIANTDAIKQLLAHGKKCSLVALSVADCALTDDDILHLVVALQAGLPVTMLKLSSNRIGDRGVLLLVDALLSHSTHSLKLIDLFNNRMGAKGAEALTKLYTSTSHTTQLRTLNLSKNNIEGHGLEWLVSVVGSGKLTTLIANNQEVQYEEEDMERIFTKLAETLGLSTECSVGICPVPTLTDSLTLKLTGLGGFTGELGRLIDSMAILTDQRNEKRPHMSTTDILQIAAALKGQTDPTCLMTKEEWDNVIGASKEAPRWLQLADHRARATYLSHLPAAITPNKMEGLLEVEADCNIDEIVLMKDQLTRKNNGLAWILFSDIESVDRAVSYYNSGEAKVFSQPFMLSRLDVKVDDEGSQQAQAAARVEMSRRAADRAQDEAAHRKLLRQNYVESQARHAYRLANPAYADGRIW